MGGGNWTNKDWDNYASKNVRGMSTSNIYKSNNIAEEFDPSKIVIRESFDSIEHPSSTPIIIGLDVTGSMGGLLQVVAEKLGDLVGEILERNPVTDPQIMFMAIGDSYGRGGNYHDEAPLQVTQFESDIRIAEQLTKLWFEQGGWGNGFESYPLAWYFAANKTKIDSFDKRGEKGFIFTIGDDSYPSKITKEEIKRVFGDDVEADLSIEEIIAQVNRKYEVFHLCMKQGGSHREKDAIKWKGLLGERAIIVSDYSKIPEIMISIIETMSGKPIDEVVKSWDGSTAVAVKQAIGSLPVGQSNNNLVEF